MSARRALALLLALAAPRCASTSSSASRGRTAPVHVGAPAGAKPLPPRSG